MVQTQEIRQALTSKIMTWQASRTLFHGKGLLSLPEAGDNRVPLLVEKRYIQRARLSAVTVPFGDKLYTQRACLLPGIDDTAQLKRNFTFNELVCQQ